MPRKDPEARREYSRQYVGRKREELRQLRVALKLSNFALAVAAGAFILSLILHIAVILRAQ